jgi:hypothetical protein
MEDLLQDNKTINQLDHKTINIHNQDWATKKSATMLKVSSKVFPKITPKEYLNSKPKP